MGDDLQRRAAPDLTTMVSEPCRVPACDRPREAM